MTTGKLLELLLVWRIALFFILFFALSAFPLQFNFLGGGLSNYLEQPYLWSSINFDGEHYFSIAQNGYKPLQYFFFPLYPLLIGYITEIIGQTTVRYALSGLFLSHIALFFACLGIVKLVRMEFDDTIAKYTILMILLFPTAFYLVSYYTESLFLALSVWSFYFLRKKNWFLASILAAFLCATRIIGIAIIPAFLIEAYVEEKKFISRSMMKAVLSSLIALLGIGLYMLFLQKRTDDPIAFFTSLNMVYGEQRSNSLILLPQVYFRYFIRILPNLSYSFWPLVYTTYLELITAILFFVLSIVSFFKLRLSYTIYMVGTYIIPTLSGSFSSFPRYVLVFFPGFIIMALYASKFPRVLKATLFSVIGILLFISMSLFVRGYWIS